MKCKNCGNPLPGSGVVCKFCGALMDREQINYQNKMKDKENQRIMLLSEKYGHENKIEYREKKENKINKIRNNGIQLQRDREEMASEMGREQDL